MRFWGLKNCDSCKKAQKALVAAGYDLNVTDVRADGVAPEDLARFHGVFGEALVNKRSTTWRGLSEDERAGDPLLLLATYPTLMKRPVVEKGDQLTLGWDKKTSALWLDTAS
ncbi:arsenate reductase [Aliiroseovarius sp. KMU-50]|uniref:Arsenate reductase n=1 Tax=Aliiroseovarius salicola TaxID=3009082 RepID=A0ABT4W193_9RHOB|nr:ArsC/Spx/MgsR family protein [Aliiroseovarius sp. KMU-50]MDA5094265.1 arsenate reductase [Aliiroseovarius sp. KMU-50]